MRKKPAAWGFVEGDGIAAERCSSREMALKVIQQYLAERKSERTITLDDIVKTREYKHRNCEMYTIGEPDACIECGEPHTSAGRPVFVIYGPY